MNISFISINRPVLTSVMSVIILLFGAVGFSYLGLREYPSVDPPIVTVSTTYTGANADIIANQITEPLETSINGISGIRSLTSSSAEGRSTITVEFDLDVDMEAAANDVRDRVSRSIRSLPPDIDPPIVVKSDADADAIIILSVRCETRNLLELTDIANTVFKERLQTISGVSEIRIFGEKKYSMKLLLDPFKMASYQLTPTDIRNALNRENVELPSGRIEGYQTELSIRTSGRLNTEKDFNDLIIKEEKGAIVRFADIGQAKLLPENERTILKGKGAVPQVGIAINPIPGSNHIAIADELYKRVEQIKKELPAGIHTSILMDTTTNIRKAISEVEETIFIAFVLVVLIIFLFLRQWRTTLIPVLAIPISLIGAFFIMYIASYTINILTLLGIVLATGLVVDDAIVVLENIYKRIEKGENPKEAGYKGSKEIFFAIISTTITLAAVFLPIIFLKGLTGRLFREFAVVLAGSVLISAFVSLTLTPMMSTRILKKNLRPNAFYRRSEHFYENLTSFYRRTLTGFIEKRFFAFIIILVSLLIIYGIGILLPSELAPMEDKGRIRILSTAPEGIAFETMEEYMDQIIALTDTIPENEGIIAVTAAGFSGGGTNSGFVRLSLSPPGQRKRTQKEIADILNASLQNMTLAKSFATQEQTLGDRRGQYPVQIVLLAPNFQKLKEVVPSFMEKIQANKKFQTSDINLKFNKPELKIEIDRERAKALGLSVRDVAENLQLFYSGIRYGYFILNDRQYQVIGQADRQFRDEPEDIYSLYIRNSNGNSIQLQNILKITEQSNPPQLYRFNRFVSATISAQPAEGLTIGQGIEEIQNITKEHLPEDFATALTGLSRDFSESSGSLLYAFFFALVLIFLVLAAQFESYRDPFIIMFTVPLAIAGAVLSLYLFGHTLNIFSQIGIIMLVGIVTKNGILIVEFANQRKTTGLSRHDAVIDAATQRLRPILMTSLATIFGALPIALALGAASKSRIPMGIAVIGGLLFALLLTLYVIPALYTYISKEKKHDNI